MLNAIGIPSLRKFDEIAEHNLILLKASYLYGIPVFLYNIREIPSYIKNGVISSVYWENGELKPKEIDLPKYSEIYCSTAGMRRHCPECFDWINQHTIITDLHGLGKTEFQNKLLFSELSEYAIPTISLCSYDQLVSNASAFPVSFLKPANSSKARGTMKLHYTQGKLLFSTPEGTGELTEKAFVDYFDGYGFHGNFRMMLEPCLNILNDDGRAVDFRCQVSLNGQGEWQNVMTYARIGGTDVASNFSHGGSLNFAEEVLEQLIPGQSEKKLKEINDVALKVAAFVQRESPNRVSWLGLDICIDRPSNQIYVIEANSKPGTKLVGSWPLALVRAQYFRYLLSQEEK